MATSKHSSSPNYSHFLSYRIICEGEKLYVVDDEKFRCPVSNFAEGSQLIDELIEGGV